MQLIHNFDLSLEDYAVRGKGNDFPVIASCPILNGPRSTKAAWLLLA